MVARRQSAEVELLNCVKDWQLDFVIPVVLLVFAPRVTKRAIARQVLVLLITNFHWAETHSTACNLRENVREVLALASGVISPRARGRCGAREQHVINDAGVIGRD